MESSFDEDRNTVGIVIGWIMLLVFALGFTWYVGKPLIVGEQWQGRENEAIDVVKNYKPFGDQQFYDMIRAYSLRTKDQGNHVHSFNWGAIHQDGPRYEVTLLWQEGSQKKVAIWMTNIETGDISPQGEAANLPDRVRE